MADTVALNIPYLSTFCAVPETTLHSLIHNPDAALVTSFLQQLVPRAQENEKLKSHFLRRDVELESAVRGAEARARTFKTNSDKALKETDELRQKLNEQESVRAKINDQLHALQTDTANSTGDLEDLRAQVTKLEKSNRNTVALLDAKSSAHDRLVEELSSTQQKVIEQRREALNLSEQLQGITNSVNNSKLLEAQLRAEIDQQKRNNDWLDSELKTKAAEHSKFRREKNAKIVELQRSNDDANEKIELLQNTETSLRKHLNETEQKTEDAFVKIARLEGDAFKKEESFRLELETSRRLTDLQKQTAETARRRVQELEDDLERVKDEAAEEIGQAQAEIETERQDKEAAESRVEQLESHVEKLEASIHIGRGSYIGGTPRPAINGSALPGTPTRGGSPLPFSPGSSRSRGGLNYTQMYADYTAAKTELELEKQRNTKLSTTLDELIQEMERKEPEVQETRLEHERLHAENAEISNLLLSTREERDISRREARKLQVQVTGFRREAELLKQQLRDLSSQIKILLVEVQIREEGAEFSADDRAHLQRAARGEIDTEGLEGMSDTAKFISQRLVSYKNAFELQEKNVELLRIVRELGEQREVEEAKAKTNGDSKTLAELETLRERVEKYKDEVQTLVTQSQSYVRERDMFRRILSHRGQLPPDADLESIFGNSVNGGGSPRTPHKAGFSASRLENDQSPSKVLTDLTKALKDQQSQFDAYRRETATDFNTVKEQASTLSKEKAQLQAEVARVNSQLTLAYERYQMLQANFDLMKSESKEMQKRSQSLAENAAKQDLKTQQVAEELVEAKSTLDSMRYESAHLKAENELWKNTQTRLSEDNRLLVEERTRLSKALSDAQHIANERELADMETRRKLQTRSETLEVELRTVKEQLERELESSKNATLRRELETDQHRTRVDDLMKAVANAKEDFIASKAIRDQLEVRVEEFKIELQNAEERIAVLQPSTVPTTTDPMIASTAGLSREQELGLDIAELRKELDSLKAEVEGARTQAEQYKAISQSSEEELQALNDTHDQYREEMDTLISEKDTRIRDLEQRVQDILSELNISNEQLSTLRSTAEDGAARLENQRAYFEMEIARVRDEAERHREAAAFHQEDLKAQADIAQQAQQSYESELVKHGEATKTLQTVRSELNQIKLDVAQYKAVADSANTKLSQNEDGWAVRREQYEKEMDELKVRHDEVNEQNKILHQQLESFSAQLASLQQSRANADSDSASQGTPDSNLRNLQEVIKYLRREKEIVDVQYELTLQESKRLRQQLDYSQSLLDETRIKLDQERQRQNTEERHAMSHTKLMETLNELNVFRESSVTLRNESRQAQAQLAERTAKVEELIAQIQPLQATIRELEEERDAVREQFKGLEEERDSWRERMQNILGTYDRIDPAELESLREQLAKLESERDEVVTKIQSLQEQVDKIPEELRTAQDQARKELRERLVEQFKARSRELSGKINEANSQNVALKEQLEAMKSELDAAKAARDEAIANASEINARRSQSHRSSRAPSEGASARKTTEGNQSEDGEVVENDEGRHAMQEQLNAAESKAQEEAEKAADYQREADALKDQITQLQSRINELEQSLSAVNVELSTLKDQARQPEHPEYGEHLEKVKQDLAAAQNELEAMRVEAHNKPAEESTIQATTTPISEQVEARVASLRADLEAAHVQRMQEVEETYKSRVDNMKQQLTNKLREGKETYRAQMEQELQEAHKNALEKLTHAHEASIEKLQKDHDEELTVLRNEEKLAREQLKQQLMASNSNQVDAASSNSTAPELASIMEPATPTAAAEWSSDQVKAFISKNQTAKDIMLRNLRSRVEVETTKLREQSEKLIAEKLEESRAESEAVLSQKLEEARVQSEAAIAEKTEQIKVLEDARQKAEKSKEQAVSMESKKWTAKVSMAEARSKMSNAKLGVVSAAAADTPERPVGEVWAIAKDAKPSPIPVTTAATQTTVPAAQVAQTPDVRKPSVVGTNDEATIVVTNVPTTSQSQVPSSGDVLPADSGAVVMRPSGDTNVVQAQTAPQSSLAQGNGPQGRPSFTGTGPGALRGLVNQGSGIPTRGGATARGTGQRGGRGGLPEPIYVHVPNGPPQMMPVQPHLNQTQRNSGAGQMNSNLPRRGGGDNNRGGRGRGQQGPGGQFHDRNPGDGRGGGTLNPNAGQFNPNTGSNKRPHSPGDNIGDMGGKRPRGGMGGN